MDFLTTEQSAEKFGVTPRRVQAMAQAGRLPASRFGRALMIREVVLLVFLLLVFGSYGYSAHMEYQINKKSLCCKAR
jgi:excisionase family DNA binding protein